MSEHVVHHELAELDRSIKRALNYVFAWIFASVFCYTVWLFAWKSKALEDAPSAGGVFGDFFGGVLNPVISLAAFYW